MGISNFPLLVDCFDRGEDQFHESFDSILFDIQSFIYVAIDQAFTSLANEKRFLYEISTFVQSQLAKTMIDIFDKLSFEDDKEIVVICSFDGEGVPMKWPTQRKRRQKADVSGKNLYRIALFGNNSISTYIQNHLVKSLKNNSFHEKHFKYRTTRRNKMPRSIRYIVSGCDVEGEGEHKIFHIAEKLLLRKPVVVSVDNDAFILSFMRIDKPFMCIQLYRQKKIYNCTHFAKYILQFPIKALIFASFLFGNDFIPPILSITNNNHECIHTSLLMIFEKMVEEDLELTLPIVVNRFLKDMEPHMKFDSTPSLNRDALIQFWMTCLWIDDYYRKRHFPQKYMQNKIFDNFDRNNILTGLLDEEIAIETFDIAKELYNDIKEEEQQQQQSSSILQVFDEETLNHLSRYFVNSKNNISGVNDDEEEEGGFCHDIKISTLKRK